MLASRKHLIPRPSRIVLAVILIYAFCWIKGWPAYYDEEELPAIARPQLSTALGPHLVDSNHLIVTIVTAATEAYAKLAPALLHLDGAHHQQLLLMGDLHMEIGPFPVFDVLQKYPVKFRADSEELERYKRQLDFNRQRIPLTKLRQSDPIREKEELAKLAKYKILKAMQSAWEYRPERDWYVFTDEETYVDRGNLLDWLSQFDPKAKHFFGNPSIPDTPDPFSAGGSSFILSGEAMRLLFEQRKAANKMWENWDPKVKQYATAHELVTRFLKTELSLDMQSTWPGASGFDPSSIPFAPGIWCEPVLMMHHVSAEMGSILFQLEKDRRDDRRINNILLYADLWNRFLAPENLNDTRYDWDNLSAESSNHRWNILFADGEADSNRPSKGENSPAACKASCDNSKYCVQWSYSSIVASNWNENGFTKCHLSSSMRLGAFKEPDEVEINGEKRLRTWQSGWRKDKFQAWANQQRCKSQQH
jgi:hypothetical protein